MNEDHIKQYGLHVAEKVRDAIHEYNGVDIYGVDLQAIISSVAVPQEKNTQQPVAWRYMPGKNGNIFRDTIYFDRMSDRFESEIRNIHGLEVRPLYSAPPVPRDVLMSFGTAVRDAAKRADFDIGEDVDIASIADRYASKVPQEPTRVLTDDELWQLFWRDTEVLATGAIVGLKEALRRVHQAGAVATKPEPVNQQGMRKKFEEWAPAKGYDIRPSRIGLPFADGFTNSAWEIWQAAIAAADAAQPVCQTCKGSGYIGDFLTLAHDCPDCQQPASAQPVAVPDGYALVRQENLRKLKASINGECYMGQVWEAETVSAMLSAAQKPEGV